MNTREEEARCDCPQSTPPPNAVTRPGTVHRANCPLVADLRAVGAAVSQEPPTIISGGFIPPGPSMAEFEALREEVRQIARAADRALSPEEVE